MSASARFVLTSLLAASSAFAHCQLAWPYPLHSSLNPATPEAIKDYSMTSPLVTDGTYPCKGFINLPTSGMGSVVTWDAGASINYTIAGTATHNGGSCQISMSYDDGATWNVIFSYIGGCLIEGMTEEITIPSDAPSGDALFAWGWFNLNGNREMYHNCASVTITNGGSGFNDDTDYPTPFVANADVNDCVTIENTAVVFPNPGKKVKYGGAYASTKPTIPAGYTGSNCVGPGANSTSSTSSSTAASSSSAIASSTAVIATSAAGSASSSAIATSSSPASSAAASSTSITSKDSASTSTLSAASAHTTLWSITLDETTTVVSTSEDVSSSNADAVAASGTSSAISSATAVTCKSKRRRRAVSTSETENDRRHQRLVRRPKAASASNEPEERDSGRAAARPATHNNAKRSDDKRVAASRATHNKRDSEGKRVAANRATHTTAEDNVERGEGRVAANKASHVEQRRRQSLKEMFGLFHS